MLTEAEILKLARDMQANKEQFLNKIKNNEVKNKLDYIMKMDAQLQSTLANPQISGPVNNPNHPQHKLMNDFVNGLRMAYFQKVTLPGVKAVEAAAQAEKDNESLLQYALQTPKKSATIDPTLAEIMEKNTEGEDLETELSDDDKIEKFINNDPDVPDNLGPNKHILEDLQEETIKMEKDAGLGDDVIKETAQEFQRMMASVSLYPKLTPGSTTAAPQTSTSSTEEEERKKSPRPKFTPFDDPKNPFA